jgi:hypothetical protein
VPLPRSRTEAPARVTVSGSTVVASKAAVLRECPGTGVSRGDRAGNNGRAVTEEQVRESCGVMIDAAAKGHDAGLNARLAVEQEQALSELRRGAGRSRPRSLLWRRGRCAR